MEERWPEQRPTDTFNSKRRRLRNPCDMGASQGSGKGRYDQAAVGFVSQHLEHLVMGRRQLAEGQHQVATGAFGLVMPRSQSPVNMKLSAGPPRSPSMKKCSHDSPEFAPELAYRLTKPRTVVHRFPPQLPQKDPAPPRPQEPPSTPTAISSHHQLPSPTLSVAPLRNVPAFALSSGRDSPPYFGPALSLVPKGRAPAKAAHSSDVEVEERGRGPPKVRGADYRDQLLNINSVSDYYDVVRLWEVPGSGEKGEAAELRGKEARSQAHPSRELDLLARAAAFAKVGWRDTAAGDKDERIRRRKARGHDFSVTTGRSSPLYYFTDAKSNDLDYPAQPGGVAAQGHGGGTRQPLGVASGRKPPGSAPQQLDVNKILKEHTLRQGKRSEASRKAIAFHTAANPLTWTSPEYWVQNPQKGGPISFKDDFILNPESLTTNTFALESRPAPMGMYQGRLCESPNYGSKEARNKMKMKLAILSNPPQPL